MLEATFLAGLLRFVSDEAGLLPPALPAPAQAHTCLQSLSGSSSKHKRMTNSNEHQHLPASQRQAG